MLGRFSNLNKMKTKIISNHMSQYFIHNRTWITKWAHLKFDACTGLKIVGTGACLPSLTSPLLFKTVWRCLGIEVMSFWSFGVAVWSHSCLIQVSSCWRVCGHLWHIFHWMMRQMFSRWKIWTAGRPLLVRSHAVVIAAVCGFALSYWNTRHLEGSICCSKTFIYLSAFIVPSKTCKLPIMYARMHLHTIRDAGFWTERW